MSATLILRLEREIHEKGRLIAGKEIIGAESREADGAGSCSHPSHGKEVVGLLFMEQTIQRICKLADNS